MGIRGREVADVHGVDTYAGADRGDLPSLPDGWTHMRDTFTDRNRRPYSRILTGLGALLNADGATSTVEYNFLTSRLATVHEGNSETNSGEGNFALGPLLKVNLHDKSVTLRFEEMLGPDTFKNAPDVAYPEELSLTHAAVKVETEEEDKPVEITFVTPHMEEFQQRWFEAVTLRRVKEGDHYTMKVTRRINPKGEYEKIALQLDEVVEV